VDERRREVNVRLAIGAGRWRIVRQLLTETVIVASAGGLLGLAICRPAAAAVTSLVSLDGSRVHLPIEIDSTMLLFVTGMSIAAALVCGIVPAMRATRGQLAGGLQQGSRSTTANPRRRLVGRTVAAVQLGLSVVLISGAFLFAFSLYRLTHFDTGLDRRRLTVADVDMKELGFKGPQMANLNRRILERIGGIGGVEAVSFSEDGIYSRRNSNTQILADGFQAESGPNRSAYHDDVGPHYFTAIGARILAGRDFNERDNPSAPKVAIVTQEFARHFFAGRDPIGLHIYKGETVLQVVGVVQDIRYDIRLAPRRQFYVPQLQTEGELFSTRFVVRTRTASPIAADLRAAIRSENAAAKILSIDSADELLNRTIDLDRLVAMLASAFGVLAVILAAVGIYGLLAYDVTRRTSEIGVRMALGATRRQVMKLIFREVVLVVTTGLVTGLAAALGLGQLVAGLVFGLTPGHPAVLASGAFLLALVAAGAAWFPALRAARLDPMVALRHE